MSRLLLILASLILAFPLPTQAAISPTLSISPAKYELTIIPGQIQQVTISITNRSTVAIPAKVAIMDFAPKDDKGAIDFGRSLPNHSATSWFKADKTDVLMKPGESVPVKVDISPPDIVSSGSYFAVLMFQSQLPSNYFDNEASTQAEIVPWIGTLFLLKTQDQPKLDDNSLTVKRFSVPRFTAQSTIPVSIEIKNNTNFHLQPETHFKLKSVFGTVDATADNPETTIMPGQSRIFTASIKRPSFLGLYRSVAELQVADWHKSVTSRLVYLLTIPGIVILLVASFIFHHGFRGRRRFIRAWRALLAR